MTQPDLSALTAPENAVINKLMDALDEVARIVDVAIDAYGEEHDVTDRLVLMRDRLEADIRDLTARRRPGEPR